MSPSGVERDLELTTPVTKGPDVKELQEGLNAISRKFPRLLEFKLREDKKLGENTLDAAFAASYVLGLSRRRLNQIEKKKLIVQPVQQILCDPRTRSDEQKERGRKRCDALRRQLNRRPSLPACASRDGWRGSLGRSERRDGAVRRAVYGQAWSPGRLGETDPGR